jgi:hypothetical protein
MRYAGKGNHFISRWTWKCIKKLFSQLLDLIIFNRYIFLTSRSSKLLHMDFQMSLVRDPLEEHWRVFQTGDCIPRNTNPFHQLAGHQAHSTLVK